MSRLNEITVKLDADEFIESLKEYERVINELALSIQNLQVYMHTLGNIVSGKLSAVEAEAIARQVARETVEALKQNESD
jgi:hypothetical protein